MKIRYLGQHEYKAPFLMCTHLHCDGRNYSSLELIFCPFTVMENNYKRKYWCIYSLVTL